MHPDPDELGPDASSFAHLFEVGSTLEPEDFDRVEPPEDLWNNIASRLDDPVAVPDTEAPSASDPAPPSAAIDAVGVGSDDRAIEESVRDLNDRRRRRMVLVGAAAAVVLVVAGAIGIGLSQRDDRSRVEVLATARLDVLEGSATAQAELVRTGGQDRLVVTADNLAPAPAGTHYELWLIDRNVTDPRSLGPMTGSTEVAVPSTIDPAEFPVVDISLQQDGTRAHSGQSLLRGTLE
ncbi:hypothetical protein BH10ACT3_BH10ACT3_22530 [soil metagenome]